MAVGVGRAGMAGLQLAGRRRRRGAAAAEVGKPSHIRSTYPAKLSRLALFPAERWKPCRPPGLPSDDGLQLLDRKVVDGAGCLQRAKYATLAVESPRCSPLFGYDNLVFSDVQVVMCYSAVRPGTPLVREGTRDGPVPPIDHV